MIDWIIMRLMDILFFVAALPWPSWDRWFEGLVFIVAFYFPRLFMDKEVKRAMQYHKKHHQTTRLRHCKQDKCATNLQSYPETPVVVAAVEADYQ